MIELKKKEPEQFDGDLLVYFIRETGGNAVLCPCKELRRNLKPAWKNGDFTGKKGQVFLFYPTASKKNEELAAERILAVGLGRIDEGAADKNGVREQLRLAAGTVVRRAAGLKVKNLMAVLPEHTGLADAEVAECVTEGLLLANYSFDLYRTKKKDDDAPAQIQELHLQDGGLDHEQVKVGMIQGERAARAACAARDMANEPGNAWTPRRFAEFGTKLAKEHGLECTVLDKAEMKKLGMGGILGVSRGSAQPPKLVILRYHGGEKKEKMPTLMLVGKGLTFDSGGICLKSPQGMEEMKYDMCGGAAAICAMQAIAEEKIKGLNVIALIPAAENLPSAAALKPGDIITHFGGITSEIINTDAEGRLILADALAYGIATWKPDAVVDLATLTGAVIVGLGHHRSGLLSTDDALAEQLTAAGERVGEPLWRLPLGPEYSKQIKSTVADIKNSGGKEAGTITAAAYLQEFVGSTPWAHLDIAGTAWSFTEKSYVPKGPSGIGVRTLLQFVRSWQPVKR
jgi:leucyl aminopeptidase